VSHWILVMPLALVSTVAALPATGAVDATEVERSVWWLLAGHLALVVIGLVGSGLFSGTETAVYSMSRVRLLLRHSRSDPRAVRLRVETDNPQRLLSTLLIGNNAVNFLASFGIAAILTDVVGLGEWPSIIVQTLFLTPLLFVFGETLPKELGRAHADEVAYAAALPLRGLRLLLTATGLLPIVTWLGRTFARIVTRQAEPGGLPARARVTALLHEGVGHGVLSPQQTDLAEGALRMRDMQIRRVMIPWTDVETLDETATKADLVRRWRQRGGTTPENLPAPRLTRTRYPVIARGGGRRVVGIVNILELLAREEESIPAGELAVPAVRVPETESLTAALRRMHAARADLAVVHRSGRPVGVVALIDLVRPLAIRA